MDTEKKPAVVEDEKKRKSYRDNTFLETYGNNVIFENSVWDLKLTFSVLDQTPDTPPFKEVCAVRIPWAQAKIMAYFLSMNVAFHESANGTIELAAGIVPPPIDPVFKDAAPDDEQTKALVARIKRMRAELGV